MAPRKMKSTRRPKRSRFSSQDYGRPSWTPAIASAWSNIPSRVLYRLLETGVVPCIVAGRSRTQNFPLARDGKRTRECFKYVIPAESFRRWFNNLGAEDAALIRRTQIETTDPAEPVSAA